MNISTNFITADFLFILGSGVLVAAAGSLLGIFLVSRKMALVSDALSHVALPGVGLAFILNFDIFWGVLLALIPVLLVLNLIEQKVRIDFSTLVGIIFAFSLAVGVFLLPGEELLEGLFGDIGKIMKKDFLITMVTVSFVAIFIIKYYRELLLISFSEEWARIKKTKVTFINALFYVSLALIIALGIKIIGALLISSLLIIPASSAINLARNSKEMIILSLLFGVLGMTAGLLFAESVAEITSFAGPVVIIAQTAIFAFTFAVKKIRSKKSSAK